MATTIAITKTDRGFRAVACDVSTRELRRVGTPPGEDGAFYTVIKIGDNTKTFAHSHVVLVKPEHAHELHKELRALASKTSPADTSARARKLLYDTHTQAFSTGGL